MRRLSLINLGPEVCGVPPLEDWPAALREELPEALPEELPELLPEELPELLLEELVWGGLFWAALRPGVA